jgi:hypothetical protein
MLRVHVYAMSLLNVHVKAACPYPYYMPMSVLHVYVQAACPCLLYAGCLCLHTACLCCMNILHGHGHGHGHGNRCDTDMDTDNIFGVIVPKSFLLTEQWILWPFKNLRKWLKLQYFPHIPLFLQVKHRQNKRIRHRVEESTRSIMYRKKIWGKEPNLFL